MKFVLAAIVLAAVVAVLLLLMICCFRWFSERWTGRERPQALQFEDDLSRRHLLEEGEEEPPNPHSPSQKRLPPQNRYFVLGGHRFEATSSGYRQIDDSAMYDAADAQNLALNADDANAHVAEINEDMVNSDDNPKPRKTRHPLAIQFSAMAHSAEINGNPILEPNATRQFLHETKPHDNYVWPSRGGTAAPIHVDWGTTTPSSASNEQDLEGQHQDQDPVVDHGIDEKDESGLTIPVAEEQVPDEIIPKEEDVEDHQEQLVKTDQNIVPKPKSKKGKKRQPQLPIDQLET